MEENYFSSCPVCDASRINQLTGYSKDYLVQCENCKFVFAQRIPTLPELIAHYETYPRTNSISDITIKRYNELLDYFEAFRNTNNIIDVGCGDGFFLETAKKRGWNVYGTEYTDIAIKICNEKGITMHQGKLDTRNYAVDFFDVITSFEVIEHINNPTEEIQNFAGIIRKGGIVYVTTPNFNSAARLYLKNTWTVIEYPEHLSYYTRKTLSYLFEKNGFKTIRFQTTGISFNRIQSSQLKAESKPTPAVNTDEMLRSKSETNPLFKLAKKAVNTLLTISSKGDTLKGTFEKN